MHFSSFHISKFLTEFLKCRRSDGALENPQQLNEPFLCTLAQLILIEYIVRKFIFVILRSLYKFFLINYLQNKLFPVFSFL